MTKSLGQPQVFVGVDVSEGRLDVHVLPAGKAASFARDAVWRDSEHDGCATVTVKGSVAMA